MSTQSIQQLIDLSGKVALVTGGALGIGQAIAFRLAEAGASVMIADINQDAAYQTAEQIKSSGGKAASIYSDTSNVAEAPKVVQSTVDTLGGLDILVNNAGVYPVATLLQLTEATWDKVLDVNLKGYVFYAQAAAQQMIKAGRGGRIVNVASIDGLHPGLGLLAYDSSKGGVVMLTKSLALELGQHKIRVNAIAPGYIQTPGTASNGADFIDLFKARVPLGRLGEPDDVAKLALLLASDLTDYMTGDILVADGGFLLS